MSRHSIRFFFAVSALILCALWSGGDRLPNSKPDAPAAQATTPTPALALNSPTVR